MDYTKELHELCDTIGEAIAEANEKIRNAGGKLTAGDVDYVDKLTHAMKSIKTTLEKMEGEEYSGYWPGAYDDGTMNRGYSRRMYNGSYARGRGSNAKRDSMGRYSSEGYSRHGDMMTELRELMEDAPDERTRQEFQRFIHKLENA